METYTTTDFYTAAVLISKGFFVHEVTSDGGSKKRFHFAESADLQQVRLAYINGHLQGNIKEFKNAIETVKDMIHSS